MATLLSTAAVQLLAAERTTLALRHVADQPWAFCECFVPGALIEHGARHTPIRKVADTTLFQAEFAMLETDARLRRPGSLFHAVLDRARLCKKLDRVTLHLVSLGNEQELDRLRGFAVRNRFVPLFEAALTRAREAHLLATEQKV